MKGLIVIIYIALSITQFAALCTGLTVWFGLHWFIAGILAFFVAPMPLVGTIAGMCGAVYGWGWSWIAAVALFFGWFLVIIVLGVIESFFFKERSMLD